MSPCDTVSHVHTALNQKEWNQAWNGRVKLTSQSELPLQVEEAFLLCQKRLAALGLETL